MNTLAAAPRGFRGYFSRSRDVFTSVVLVMPLFFIYQIGVLATGGLRNGVDFVTTALFALLGGNVVAYVVFNLVVMAGFVIALLFLRKRGSFEPRLVPWILLESTVYAVLLGSVVVALINSLGLGGLLAAGKAVPVGMFDKVVMSAGAGLYEEIVFRAFLMGGMIAALTKGLSVPRLPAVVVAIVASSVLFSAAHHITEPFTMSAFVFRIFAGILFAVVYRLRGLAVAAYTHAIYDVWVMVLHG